MATQSVKKIYFFHEGKISCVKSCSCSLSSSERVRTMQNSFCLQLSVANANWPDWGVTLKSCPSTTLTRCCDLFVPSAQAQGSHLPKLSSNFVDMTFSCRVSSFEGQGMFQLHLEQTSNNFLFHPCSQFFCLQFRKHPFCAGIKSFGS